MFMSADAMKSLLIHNHIENFSNLNRKYHVHFRVVMLHIILMIFLHLAGIIMSITSKSYSVCFKWPAYVKL